MALTDSWLKANNGKACPKIYTKADRDGLSVRVTPLGKITFQLRYRFAGQAKRLDLGTYPLTTLKQARDESTRLRSELEQGNDPKQIRLQERTAKAEAITLEQLIRQWYDSDCIRKTGHQEIMRSFELYVIPAIGAINAEQVTLRHWMPLLEDRAKHTPAIAERLLSNGKQLLGYGVRRHLITQNVLLHLTASRDLHVEQGAPARALDDDEIAYFFSALAGSRMARKNKLFLELCLIYGCRNGELRLAKKKHFDFKERVWTVPAENHKLGKKTQKPLLRPITDEAEALIKEAFLLNKGSYAFCNAGSDKPMSRSAVVALPYNLMQWLRRHREYEMLHWSVHDLRKTARTNYSSLTEPHIAEIMLGHKLPGDWQTYDLHHYLPDQAELITKWCDRLGKIKGHAPA